VQRPSRALPAPRLPPGMFLPVAFQLRRERSSPVGMKPCWLVQVPAVSNRPAQEALAAQAAGTNRYGVAGSAWLHTFSRRTAGSGGPGAAVGWRCTSATKRRPRWSETKYRYGAINVVRPREWTARSASDSCSMSRALCPCDVMTSHIAVLLCGDLFHLVSRIAPKSHSIYPADAQYAPRLAAIVVLEPAERCDAAG
jgi:hypothetical protein